MDVGATFVTNGEAAEAIEPGERAFDDPAVAAELLAAVDATPGDTRLDVTLPATGPAAAMIERLVGVELIGPTAGPPAGALDGRNGIEHRFQHQAVVPVGRAQEAGERRARAVDHKMALRARFAAIRRAGAGLVAPFFAGTAALSRQARDQSRRSAPPSRFKSSWCSRAQTPVFCQSRKRRQQVMPDPQPISCGSISQGMPVRSTNKMPLSAARSSTGGRPPFGFGRGGGNSGATADQRSSETRGFAIPRLTPLYQFC